MGTRRRLLSLALAVCLTTLASAPGLSSGAVASYKSIDAWPAPTWHLKEPTGIAFDSAGNAYVADRGHHQIKKFSPAGTLLATFGSEGTEPGKFKSPTGVAVDRASGRLYVADTGNHRIQKLTLAGTPLKVWGRVGGPDPWGAGDGEFNDPTGIAVGTGGYVYVADRDNNRVQKFDSEGVFKLKWGNPGQGDGQFYAPHGIATDAAGQVYVVEGVDAMALSRIQVFDANGAFITKQGRYSYINEYPAGEGKYVVPKGVAVNPAGDVFICDTLGHVVQRLTATYSPGLNLTYDHMWGGYYRQAYKRAIDEFYAPEGAGIDPDGNLWVCDTKNDRVVKYSSGNEPPLGVNGSWGMDHGYFRAQPPGTGAADVAVAPDGYVYGSDRDNHRVQKFTADGQVQTRTKPPLFNRQWPWLGHYLPYPYPDHDYFNTPTGVACDSDSNVYVADSGNHAIKKFAPDGTYLNVWGDIGGGQAWFNNPQDVSVDASDNVYVADTGNNRIQKFTQDSVLLKTWPSVGAPVDQQLSVPSGIAVDQARGRVFVADTGKHRIVRYDLDGNRTAVWGTLGTGEGQFSSPVGLAVDPAGNLFVADRDNHRVQVFTGDGGFLTQFGSYGPEPDQFMYPTGVSLDAAGVVYVADRDNCRLQKFAPPVLAAILGVEDGEAYNEPVNVTVVFERATDTEVRLNGDVVAWTDHLFDTEGAYTVHAWATDGEQETEDQASFIVDLTPPTTTADVQAAYENAATIVLNATDGLSGVSRTRYALDGGAPVDGTTVQCAAAGDHTLQYWSEDEAGNVEEANTAGFTVTDTLPPTTAVLDPKSVYSGTANITLLGTDPGSGIAHTWWRLDGGAVNEGTSVSTSVLGAHLLEFWSEDGEGNTEAPPRTHSFSVIPAPVTLVRVEGRDRYETAVAASKKAFPSAANVVIATGLNWPDALGGAALAGVKEGPILLTDPENVPACVSREIERLGAENVFVLGGKPAVSLRVELQLARIPGVTKVTRIGGSDRYDTARKVAAEVVKDPGFDGTAFVATGEAFPDALAASPLAAAKGWPVFLAGRDAIDGATLDAMTAGHVTEAVILGSEKAIGSGVAAKLDARFAIRRLKGADRYATAVAIAAWGVSDADLDWDKLALARGDGFADALGGGVMQGRAGSVMLLNPCDSLCAPTGGCLRTHKTEINEVRFLGGDSAIGAAVRKAVAEALKR